MYITYETAQYVWDEDIEEDILYYQPFRKVPSNLPKPRFMPAKLIRIYDMTIVDGSHVNEGYCALSYSWNQSGSIFYHPFRNKYERVDMGLHKIIYYKKWNTVVKVEYVKFEGIIQQICQQFNIKYIWYDQMCINQEDKEEKRREISKMHHIYSNAYCTIALVPGYNRNDNYVAESEEYFKRLWTLEEAIKSERLLFVGQNRHKWGEDFFDERHTAVLSKRRSELNVAQILFHAHKRTSTKEHDRVFALIQLFPEFLQHIDIDYDQPYDDLMIRFYGLLAKKDISILLFFGGRLNRYKSTIIKYKYLPSWTGVNGKHLYEEVTKTSFKDHDIIGKTMYITSEFVTNDQYIDKDALTIRIKDLPPPPDDINDGNNKKHYRLCVNVKMPGANQIMRFSYYDIIFRIGRYFGQISEELKQLSRFMEIKKENFYWQNNLSYKYEDAAYINLHCLTENIMDDSSAQYTILSDISFRSKLLSSPSHYSPYVRKRRREEYPTYYYPVLKKKQGEEYWKAIGCCEIKYKDIFSNCKLPKQTFLIQ